MHNIIIYIGTSIRDLTQYTYLLNSIRAHNIDNIPVYTCVNDNDIEVFKQKFSNYNVTFLKDSDVYKTYMDNVWFKQQIIKMNFWRLGIAEHMVQIDSDSFFIRDFRVSDFLVEEHVPYTLIHENKELKEFFARYNLQDCKRQENNICFIEQGFANNSKKIRQLFNTSHITTDYDYGHPPCIWSNKVWQTLFESYMEPNGLTYETLLQIANSEQQWYGETLLATRLFQIYPKENLFKTFHFPSNYQEFKTTDKLEDLKYNYFGVCLQSNWCSPTAPEFQEIYTHFFGLNEYPESFNGQYGEDKWICENLSLPERGVVVDVGADQPIYGSNTYYFEKVLGWQSVCIDADERVLDNLKQYRSNVVHSIVTDFDGTAKFLQTAEAGISHVSNDGVEVAAKTLNTILEEQGIQEITLLDIDVEGHELEVCAGLDWNKYTPQIVVIEFVSPAGGNIEHKLQEYFNRLGNYKLVHRTTANYIYTRDR